MARSESEVSVEVVYALPDRQTLVQLVLRAGATAREAVMVSGLPSQYPDIDLFHAKIGIFGKRVPPDTILKNGDRVEIYRSLTADPKEVRWRRPSKRK